MSSRLPACTAREALAALLRAGWEVHHVRGSHHQLRNSQEPHRRVTVPVHKGDLPRVILRRVLAQAGLTEEEFRELL